MSYRSLAVGFSGINKNSQMNSSYSRYKLNGLDKNTVLEGSGIESRKVSSPPHSSTSPSNVVNKTKFIPTTKIESENWKEKYNNLQRKVQSLRKDLEMKEKVINELKNQNQVQLDSSDQELNKLNYLLDEQKSNLKHIQVESDMKLQNISAEKRELERNLKNLNEEMTSLKKLHTDTLSTMTKTHQNEISLLEQDYKSQINQIKQANVDVIKAKDAIIENLKANVANTFNDSSKERQTQIDELIKELKRVSDEAEYVKSALRKFKSSNNECSRCNLYQEKFKEVSLELTKKEGICKDLFLVCSKMESQLSQNNDFIEIWNTVKAHK